MGTKKTLRVEIYSKIGLTFLVITMIYSAILFPFEKQRRETVIKKIELSIHAIFEQRQKMIANEMFLGHRDAVELLLNQMREIEGMLAIGIFNHDGSLFAATGDTEFPALMEWERERLSGGHSFVEGIWNRREVAIYARSLLVIGETQGYVKIYYSLTEIAQETRLAITFFSMLLLTILFAMAGLLNLLLSRSVLRPVSQLIQAMRAFKDGDFGARVRLRSDNEIGEMAETFNQMSAEKASMYQELDDLNKHLEQKVTKRTEELQKKNSDLNRALQDLRTTQNALLERSQQLEAAREEAVRASQAKTEFLSHISHELRTPLNGIMGYAQILKREKGLTDLQHDGLRIIYQSGGHLLTLINDILDLSKIEARKLELAPAEIRLSHFFEGIISIIRMRAIQQNIQLLCRIDENVPVAVYADEKRLRQILLNLLGNAVKFTDSGGTVTFRVRTLSFPERRGDEREVSLRFEVEDTGIGIDAGQLRAIFLPFEQTGENRYRAAGTGLGLAISQRFAELMGSSIQVKSEVGVGSVFWFELKLPVIQSGGEAYPATGRLITGYAGQRRTVLIVDDNATGRALLVKLLTPLGFACIEAENGHEGIAKIRETPPDVALMDLVMPGMTGFELAREIRQLPHGREIVIIAVSASILEQQQQHSLAAGCDAFLPKPIEAEQLFALLASRLNLTWIEEEWPEDAEHDSAHDLPASLALPQKEVELLYELALRGDMRGIQERADSLKEMDETFHPFACKLGQLAKNFQDKQVLALIEQQMEETP